MKRPVSVGARAPVERPNICPEAELVEGMITAVNRLAATHEAGVEIERQKAASWASVATTLEELKPAAVVLHDLADRLEKLCVFLRRRGPWILASIPLIASAVGAISPNAAAALKTIIAALGAAPA